MVLLPEVTPSRSASINFVGMAWWQNSVSAHMASILASIKSSRGFCSWLSAFEVLLFECHWAGIAALCPGTWDLCVQWMLLIKPSHPSDSSECQLRRDVKGYVLEGLGGWGNALLLFSLSSHLFFMSLIYLALP